MVRKRKKKQKPLLDIVIPVHGRFDLLSECLMALPDACGDIPYQVILVDNGSPEDEAKDFYPYLGEGITVIKNKENLGFPRACNQGANKGRAPLLLHLNSDVLMDRGSIEEMVRELDDPKIGIVGAKLVFPEFAGELNAQIRPSGKIQHVGLATNIRGEFIHVYVGWSADNPRVLAVRDVYAVTGAALMTRRSIWKKAGGFNEAYGRGTYEDVDFSLTIREMGYNIIVAQKATGVHYTGATAEHYRLAYHLSQNRMIFLAKWQDRLNYTEWKTW